MDAAREARLIALVAQALEVRADGAEPDLARLCAGDEDLLPAVAEALGMAPGLPALQASASRVDPFVGRVLRGRYRLLERIGAGAMGTVYRAHDQELAREVAVKMLRGVPFDAQAEARFQREGRILASLAHPRIVPVHDRGVTDDGIAFLVLAHVPGTSLARWIADLDAADPERAQATARIGVQIAGALAAAHEQGVCHRDVKPSNILVDPSGAAWLVDFGISARAHEDALTATGTTLGTPWYMAPEQVRGRVGHEPSVDVYGLCATLWHALALRPPYEGDAAAVLARIPREDPPRLDRLARGVAKDLVAIVEHGMERDPRRRYAGAAQLEADLRSFLAGLPVSARPLGTGRRVARALRRHPARALVAVLLAVVVLLTGLGGPAFARDQRRKRDAAILAKWIELPALVTLEGRPEDRPVSAGKERDEALVTVREILALDPEHLPGRLLEAALLFDAGERGAATRALAAVARSRPSPYLTGLARCYAEARPDVAGARAVVLEGLPAAGDAFDLYAEGFQRLRARTEPDLRHAERALAQAGKELLAARDLHLLALLAVGNHHQGDRAESERWFQAAYDEAVRLEQVYGRKTARTQHAIGAALLGMRRYQEAVAPLEASLRERPGRHHVLQNLAIAKRRLGQLAEAEALLHEAHALEPRLWNTTYTLAQVLAERARYDEALATARSLDARDDAGLARKRDRLVGSIALARGIEAVAERDPGRAASTAAAARTAFLAAGAGGDAASSAPELALVDAVALCDREKLWQLYARYLVKDALEPRRLSLLARLLPEAGIPREQVVGIRAILVGIAAALAPDDAELAARARRLATNLPPLESGR